MPSYVPPKKNAACIFYVGLRSQSTGQLQMNPTLVAGDVTISSDGGSLNNLATLPVVTPAGGVAVKVALSAAEMNADNVVVVFQDQTGAEWDDLLISLQTSPNQIGDLGSGAITWTYTLTSTVPPNPPIADADVWVTTDIGGANVIASGKTDAFGVVTFYLDAGTYYIWRQKTGWNFTNPDTEVVS